MGVMLINGRDSANTEHYCVSRGDTLNTKTVSSCGISFQGLESPVINCKLSLKNGNVLATFLRVVDCKIKKIH